MKRFLYILAAVLLPMMAVAQGNVSENEKDSTDDIFLIAGEKMPEFPGGQLALFKYITDSMRYPTEAKNAEMFGRTIIQFVVEADGSLSDFVVVRSSGHEILDEEALRLLKAMPQPWSPGGYIRKDSIMYVRVKFTVPVTFKLHPSYIVDNEGFDKMTLQDFYKINYQSYFGAEHMAPDTASVMRYMQYELGKMDGCCKIPDVQNIHGYYRVSLRMVEMGLITAEQLAYAFIESARPVHREEGAWLVRWQSIEREVLARYPELADAELQAELMDAARQNAAVHHSEQYNEAYCPHYRIIRADVAKNLLSFLK